MPTRGRGYGSVALATVAFAACHFSSLPAMTTGDFAVITDISMNGTGFDSTARSTGSMLVEYELRRPLVRGALEFVIADSVVARYPLAELDTGRHTFQVPPGAPEPFDPGTFSCNIGNAPGVTLMTSVFDVPDTSMGGPSLYTYRPDPTPDNSTIRIDAASGFRGTAPGVSGFSIPSAGSPANARNGMPREVEILGVNLTEGMLVTCTKGQPAIRSEVSPLDDVRVVSTISHEDNPDIPVLQAARFSVPERVLAIARYVRIVGVPADPGAEQK